MRELELTFNGRSLVGLSQPILATCIVRNDLNGWRKKHQVLREYGGRVRTDAVGTPYQPRQFPPGRWEITEVVQMPEDGLYWPFFIRTNAWQWLPYWAVDEDGDYAEKTGDTFVGEGYAIHHARVHGKDGPVPSSTTLGCINIVDPDDVKWAAEEIEKAFGMRFRVYLKVPMWKEWEV